MNKIFALVMAVGTIFSAAGFADVTETESAWHYRILSSSTARNPKDVYTLLLSDRENKDVRVAFDIASARQLAGLPVVKITKLTIEKRVYIWTGPTVCDAGDDRLKVPYDRFTVRYDDSLEETSEPLSLDEKDPCAEDANTKRPIQRSNMRGAKS